MTAEMKIAIIAGLFVFAFVFGIRLSQLGRPLNTAIFTFHKLIALATIVFSAVTIVQLVNGQGLTSLRLSAVIVAGLLLLVTFASGAWLSIAKSALLCCRLLTGS